VEGRGWPGEEGGLAGPGAPLHEGRGACRRRRCGHRPTRQAKKKRKEGEKGVTKGRRKWHFLEAYLCLI